MSNYISKSEVIELIESKMTDGCLGTDDETFVGGHGLVDDISELPTVDETEIIRKPFERVVERLEEFTEQTYYKSVEGDMYAGERNKAYHNAIKTVKEECGINE
jgi:hypothetical protein